MNRTRSWVAVGAVLLSAAVAQAGTVGFVSNPTGNSGDFNAFVSGQGASVNTIDFESHPLGALQGAFYQPSLGVTLTASGDVNDVQSGAGPGQANDTTNPLSGGEGPHAASRFLFDGTGVSSLTVSFDSAVYGAGLFVIDYFNPNGLTGPLTIEAFSGANGTGASLGSFNSVGFNFQRNKLYFMGIGRTEGDIRSIVYTSAYAVAAGDLTGIDNIRFSTANAVPLPPAAWSGIATLGLLGAIGALRRRRSASLA